MIISIPGPLPAVLPIFKILPLFRLKSGKFGIVLLYHQRNEKAKKFCECGHIQVHHFVNFLNWFSSKCFAVSNSGIIYLGISDKTLFRTKISTLWKILDASSNRVSADDGDDKSIASTSTLMSLFNVRNFCCASFNLLRFLATINKLYPSAASNFVF